ncbi:hypothetical protein N9600_02275 [Flavobacteriaceae bacterium]|nr:hypothetical protein [Flavobacteriaceae bacterium]
MLESVYNKIGDYAKGIDSGLIEVLIVGKNIDRKHLDIISPKIKRKVNFFILKTSFDQASLIIFEA